MKGTKKAQTSYCGASKNKNNKCRLKKYEVAR